MSANVTAATSTRGNATATTGPRTTITVQLTTRGQAAATTRPATEIKVTTGG